MTLRQLSDEGRALLSSALRAAPPAPQSSSSLTPGTDPDELTLGGARAALRRARLARDAPATSAAFHALARTRLRDLQHRPGDGSAADYLVALGHALLADKWRAASSSGNNNHEDNVHATVRCCRQRLTAVFLSDFRQRKLQFQAALGPCETVEGWYAHTLMAIAPPRPPNAPREDPALRFCARGHLMLSSRDLDRHLRKFSRSHPGDLRPLPGGSPCQRTRVGSSCMCCTFFHPILPEGAPARARYFQKRVIV